MIKAAIRGRTHWLAGLALALLVACGNQQDQGPALYDIARQAAGEIAGQVGIGGGDDTAAGPADTPEAMAARALAANPGPLILADFESLGRLQMLAQTGRNGAMRTYMTPAQEALILRNGLLTGTRGLGNDLSVAEPGPMAALIRSRRAGTGQRIMRYLSGDGVERPLPLTCTTITGAVQRFPLAGRNWTALQVGEACHGQGVEIENSYLVTADGQIPVSRQWIGPALGHVVIQVIRP